MTPAELMALARFGAACLITSREELCDLDAGWLQDVAEATGCLAREERAEPCGAECRCAEEVDSFPTQCLRAPDRLWRLAVALDSGKEILQPPSAQADAVEALHEVASEHDIGYAAGWRTCADEAARIVASHIDRLEPGKQRRMRDALLDLLASMRSILVSQRAAMKEQE